MRFPVQSQTEFCAYVDCCVRAVDDDALATHDLFSLPANKPPWHDSGIDVHEGEQLTWFANGETRISRLLDIVVEPHFQLWAKIGDGEIFRSTRSTFTFTADRTGRLYFASYFPGQWSDRQGALLTDPNDYRGVGGAMDVAVLRWAGDPKQGLTRMVSGAGYGPAQEELRRLEDKPDAPQGWEYLWFLGPAEIYCADRLDNGDASIACHTHADVGILQHDASCELTPDTTLAWRWKIDALPSFVDEDLLPTHDYVSIAVEYDNGIDVTYYWSASLPEEKGYWCPLPTWKEREFHVVVRSGRSNLGTWFDEERNLYRDYERYIGKPPARIKRVWLIANSMFQRGYGEAEYSRITLGQRDDRIVIV